MRFLRLSGFLLLLVTWAGVATAEIYQWKDENGKIHFSDNKPEQTSFETLEEAAPNEISLVDDTVKGIGESPASFYKGFEVQPQGTNARLRAFSEYRYYDIHVWSVEDIVPAAIRTSPITANGKKLMAHMEWTVRWEYDTDKLEYNGCRMRFHKITVNMVYRLPRLITHNLDHATSQQVQETWRSYYTSLMKHQYAHEAYPIPSANYMSDLFNSLYTLRVRCPELEAWVKTHANKALQFYQEQEAAFDKETQYGETQGSDITLFFQTPSP